MKAVLCLVFNLNIKFPLKVEIVMLMSCLFSSDLEYNFSSFATQMVEFFQEFLLKGENCNNQVGLRILEGC